MSKQHSVYLGVPGVNFCWGTVTGVVNCSSKHLVRPYNGGQGYSCVVDFNLLWADAHNLYERGEITHFAMLHGDIEPDPSQRWLDILLDVMDRRQAALVSAVSPIKDGRGLTSSGICEPGGHWSAFRRFTQREIINDLPQEFDHAAAGYPDKPLLHNTAMWVCDMSHPAFSETNPDGTLKVIFQFPERMIRRDTGEWMKEQESEDWFLSRELWEAGVKNTWITSEPRLTHHGKLAFQNWSTGFGTFKDGDENSEHRWRPELDAKPLAVTQILEFELGSMCNLGHEHKKCPTSYAAERWNGLARDKSLDDDTIVNSAVEAYRDLGFTGLIGWIYYNEPLLQMDRMFNLMDRIKEEAPRARFILWTNGTLIPQNVMRFNAFSQIVVSNYGEKSAAGYQRLEDANLECDSLRLLTNPEPRQDEPLTLDDRMQVIEPANKSAPCLRPFTEFIVDAFGNVHLCCYDWQGKASPGNIITEGLSDVAYYWRGMLPDICGDKMTAGAPRFCQDCGHRWSERHQLHDERIIKRAERLRLSLREVPNG